MLSLNHWGIIINKNGEFMKKLFFSSFIILSITMIQNAPSYAESTNNNSNSPRWGAHEGAREVKSQGKDVNLLGLAMGAAFASQCSPHSPQNCVFAALSFMDALAGKKASNNGNATCQNYGGDCSTGGDGDGDGGPDGDGDGGPDGDGDGGPDGDPREREIEDTLRDNGYTLNPENGTVTTPGGQSYTAADAQSAQSLMNKGMSAGQAAEAMKNLAEVKAKALKELSKEGGQERGLASVSGTGGGAVSDLSSMGGGDVYVDEEVSGKKKKKKKDDGLTEAQASQLSKNFNGQPIGIGMGNLFIIVSDKYKEKRKKRNSFINREY